MNVHLMLALSLVSAAIAAAPAYSQNTAPVTTPPAQTKAADAGEVVCEKIEMIGSRLAMKKICMTRSQWAEARRQDREAIEKAQASPCVVQTTGAGGKPSC